ncbi:PREDICTED: protein trichome birefringence-like 31 [Nelumbo nucifera]|uniref:Protein trichome birefringence-like 31 n=1 Tax=Nelumbo nucifera TaxID=4432 RepID=A0A1U8B9A0_NELNU|nr:PREDICTED: protein trichome birefringence-like 31 [Nelumbo nucifera]
MATQPSSDHRILSIYPFALVSLLLFGTVRLVSENFCWRNNANAHSLQSDSLEILPSESEEQGSSIDNSGHESIVGWCNVFDGRWVLDNASHPLYTEESCPYLTKQVTCQKNGRPDSLYQNWRWEPYECKLPRFDAKKLLEALRNKRLMFIGDSIQRTQWESMVCLVQSVIPDGKKSIHRHPPMKIFRAEEFNATIEFYWAPFIVESNSDHATNHTVQRRLVKLDSIAKHSRHWEGVHVLVFESYVWWMYKPVINATNGSLNDVTEYNVTTAYRLALETWANWIESKVDPHTQRVFFMSLSPTHLWSWEWRTEGDGNCFNESYPIEGRPYWGTGSSREIMGILGDVLQELKREVSFLNITQMSEFRKDGHTSVYTERRGKLLTSEQKADPITYADCIHWCLPGVPDTWNELLYAHLLSDYPIL